MTGYGAKVWIRRALVCESVGERYVILRLCPSLVVLLPLLSALDYCIMTGCALSCGCFG